MILYLDSSVVLRHLLNQQPLLDEWGNWEAAFSSQLMGVEARRVIDRLRLSHALSDSKVALAHEELAVFERGLWLVAVNKSVLYRASMPLPTRLRTLDAIHLATAMLVRETEAVGLSFATHDRLQSIAARALGFHVLGTD